MKVKATGPDGDELPLGSLEISSDQDSFCYDLRATILDPDAAREVLPTADGVVEIETKVAGWRVDFVVEGYSLTREAGRIEYQVEGRSRTARLASPHAPPRTNLVTEDRQAIQLAHQEMDYLDTAVDYQLPNWLVPGGVWGYSDETPMRALQRLAEVTGGFVRSHRHRREVQLVPRYPVSPPDWPDADAPALDVARILQEESEWIDDERLAIAWVMGDSAQGITVRGYRAAWDQHTDGPRTASPVAYSLVTEPTPGRAQARYRIDRSGPKLRSQITATLADADADPDGFRPPGSMVRLIDGDSSEPALVVGVTVRADGSRAAQQTLDLELRPEESEWRG